MTCSPRQRLRYRHLQRGLTLLEMIIALFVLTVATMVAANLVATYSQSSRLSAAAQSSVNFAQAMNTYVNNNYAAVAAVATTTQPALITVQTLITAGYLPSGFSTTNNYGQSVCGLVLQPTANALNGIVITEGGTAVTDLDLASLAANITASTFAGGAIYSTSATTMTGTTGNYSIPVGNYANANNLGKHCDGVTAGAVSFASGHPVVAVWYLGGDTTAGMLYRSAVPGQPQLNQMATTLDMNTNAIKNITALTDPGGLFDLYYNGTNGLLMLNSTTANSKVYQADSAGAYTVYANNGTTKMMSVTQAGVISANGAVFPAGNAITIGTNNYFYGDSANAAVRTNGALYVQNAAGTAYANVQANDYMINATGKWASQMSAGNGAYIVNGSYSGVTSTWTNSSGYTWIVTVTNGDAGNNTCLLIAYVNGSQLTQAVNQNTSNAKWCSLTYMVPSGSSTYVTSYPYNGGNGTINALIYQFN